MLERVGPKVLNTLVKTSTPRPTIKRLNKQQKPSRSSVPTTTIPKGKAPVSTSSSIEASSPGCLKVLNKSTDSYVESFEISEMEFIVEDHIEEEGEDPITDLTIENIEQEQEYKTTDQLRVDNQAEKTNQFKQKLDNMENAFADQTAKLRLVKQQNEEMQKTINELRAAKKTLNDENQRQRLEIDSQKEQIARQQHSLDVALANAAEGSKIKTSLREEIESLNKTISMNQTEMKRQLDMIDQQMLDINQQHQLIQTQKSRIYELEQSQLQKPSLPSSVSTTTTTPAINTSSTAKSKPSEKLAATSKPVLFNGIRRYLNPSMVALLRMEMFGEAEREYKPDERDIAIELMKLPLNDAQPGSVYDFMRSEWRFRLPPRNSVLQWIQEREINANNIEDEWDDC